MMIDVKITLKKCGCLQKSTKMTVVYAFVIVTDAKLRCTFEKVAPSNILRYEFQLMVL